MIFPACQEPNKHVLSSEIEPIRLGQTPMYDCTPIYETIFNYQSRQGLNLTMNMTCILFASVIHMRQMANSARLGRLSLVG